MTTRGVRPNFYRVIAAATAVLLMLSYLSLEVRAIFHAPFLGRGPTGSAEQYTYSVVWLAYGVALLLFGIWQRSQPARLASAAVTLLTIAKVFLVDTAGLTGVYRALSLIGLGAGAGRHRLALPALAVPARRQNRAGARTERSADVTRPSGEQVNLLG